MLLPACRSQQPNYGEKPDVSMKFVNKEKTVHETIKITKSGEYDFQGVTHVWKGDGGCGFFAGSAPAILEIYADDVTVKNFGFRGAIYGVRIVDLGVPRRDIRLENIEGEACFKGLSLPDSVSGLWLKNISTLVWREDAAQQ
jgi:hypothetical protein